MSSILVNSSCGISSFGEKTLGCFATKTFDMADKLKSLDPFIGPSILKFVALMK